jgi:hypothetical protein
MCFGHLPLILDAMKVPVRRFAVVARFFRVDRAHVLQRRSVVSGQLDLQPGLV